MKPHLWLIKLIGLIVPQRLRSDWRQEWEAELCYREAMLADWDKLDWRAKLALLRRSLGAFRDAMWFQQARLEDEMIQDLRFGLRMLLKKPVFTLIAVLTLGLGIGANTAVFSVVNSVLLRGLPFRDSDRLVTIAETHPELPRLQVATPDFKDWQQQAQSFDSLAAYSMRNLVLTDAGEPEQLQGTCVTQNLFPLLGLSPAPGRNFLPEEEQSGSDRVVIISYDLWQRQFAGNPDISGSRIRLNGEIHTVVGVMAQGAQLPLETDVWLPISRLRPEEINNRIYHTLEVVGRLKPGVTVEQARAEMESIAGRLQQSYPATNKTIGAQLTLLHEQMTSNVRPALLALFGTVGMVLLITCANVSNLLLARAASRQKEVALRAALGAGRLRLFRQFLTESLMLASLGGVCGLLLAIWLAPLLRAVLPVVAPDQIPGLGSASLDMRVLGFTLVTAMTAGILFGIIPGLQLSRLDLNQTLKESGKASAGRSRRRATRTLVIAEVALAMVTLIGAGLLVRSFERLLRVDPGFRSDHLLSAQLMLPATKYQQYSQVKDFHQRLLTNIAALAGVDQVATIDNFPLASSNAKTRFAIEGAPVPDLGKFPVAQIRAVSPDYFDVMKIALRSGRKFTEDDIVNNRNFYIINETMARRYFSGEDPVGKKIVMGVLSPTPTVVPIIGVVADVKDLGLDAPAEPEIYYPGFNNQQLLMIRTTAEPATVAASVRQAVKATDSEQPVYQIRTMDEAVSASMAGRQLSAMLTGLFAVIALLLATIGIYGVISWSVAERTHEIGIRLALGAKAANVFKLVIGYGMKLVLIGVGIGLMASLVVTRLMKSLLFGVSAFDPATFIFIALLLVVTALLACWIPARRATKVDPMIALRYE
ncbi:MAG: ABC transporter permease [Blastocatellia bacterium]